MIGIMSKLPHTATGKIDRSRLLTDPAPLPAAMAGTDETPLENRLAPVLAGLLGHTNFTRERRFFELGPSSLELVILLQKEMQREIPLLVLLEHSTLQSLAEWLGKRTDSGAVEEGLDRGAERPKRRHGRRKA